MPGFHLLRVFTKPRSPLISQHSCDSAGPHGGRGPAPLWEGGASAAVSPGSRVAAGGTPHTSRWGLQTLYLVPGLAFVLICMVLTEVIWQY